jgi:hypothetical protein
VKPFITLVTLACFLGTVFKARALPRRPNDLRLRAVCLMLAAMTTSIGTQLLAAPIDRFTEVPMLGRVISNAAILVAAGAGQVFLIRVYYPESVARQAVRVRYLTLCLTLAAIAVLFVLTPAAPESSPARPDAAAGLPRVYDSPYLYLYFAYLAWTLVEVMRLCDRFAPHASEVFKRIGLRIVAVACVVGLLYTTTKLGILLAAELGAEIRWLEPRVAPPLFLATDALILIGVTIPAWGPFLAKGWRWVVANHAYRRLHPLWLALYRATPEIALIPPASPANRYVVRDLKFRLYRLVIEIRDGQLALMQYADPRASTVSTALGEDAGLEGDDLHAAVEASVLATAITLKANDRQVPAADRSVSTVVRADLATEIHWLLKVSNAFSHSEIVTRTVHECAAAPAR